MTQEEKSIQYVSEKNETLIRFFDSDHSLAPP